MLAKASWTFVAVTLAGGIIVAYTAPSWTMKPPRTAEEASPPGRIARCPVPQVSGEMARIFDTKSLPGGPYYVNDHTLIPGKDGQWHLFGIFHPEPYDGEHENAFVHAISAVASPAAWDAESFHLSSHAGGIALTQRPDLGETHLWAPHVIRADGRYVMVYQSGGADNDRAQIRLATSSDLVLWTRAGDAPVFEDICVARDPMVLRSGGLWTLYYTRCDSAAAPTSGVAFRTSTDLLHWSEPRMALTLESTPPMFNSGYTESPFVFEREGFYYLTVTSYPVAWDATNVYCSRSPFRFSEPPIAQLSAHAAEWIVMDRGEVFMTHAGAGQGGVWVMPVTFLPAE